MAVQWIVCLDLLTECSSVVLISFEDDFGETQKIASQGTQTRFAGNPLKMTDAESLPRNMTDLRPCSLCAC